MAAFIDVTPIAMGGYAYTKVKNKPTALIEDVRAATAKEIAKFPTAVSAIVFREQRNRYAKSVVYLTTTSVAALKTAIAA